MGNDIAGGKVTPTLEVLDQPQCDGNQPSDQTPPNVFPACAVTRARSHEFSPGDREVSLSDSLFMSVLSGDKEEKAPDWPGTAVSWRCGISSQPSTLEPDAESRPDPLRVFCQGGG